MRACLVLAVVLFGCGGGDGADFTISGRVASTAVARLQAGAAAPGGAITHIMAVDPEAAAPRRTLAAVDADGSFEIAVAPERPYVLVLVDDTRVGTDMAVAMFRAGTLDTVSPQLAGHLVLGDVAVDPATQIATAGIPYADLLESLGLDASAAELLGAVDDLSLRYANPDIDGNGVIDLLEGRDFALDFHVRAELRIAGQELIVDDIVDAFPSDAAEPVYNLTSAYVLYPAGYDATDYASTGALLHGAAYAATLADGTPATANTSFSALGFGDTRGWGADYDLLRPTLELPGSGGSPATLAYTLGATGTTLTFGNVVTRTRAALTADGTLAIFLKLVTDGDAIASVEFRWMKRTAGTWTAATAAEIAAVIAGEGGYVSIHRAPSWSNESGFQIPREPAGAFAWPLAATSPDDICGLAVSYDDKLGLRHFIGGARPNPGVVCAP